jgi:hypothetical protein
MANKINLAEEVQGLLAVTNGGNGVSSVTIAPTATAWAGWDANKNLSANAFFGAEASTVTSGTTVTLTIGSAQVQFFTGSTAQLVTLPTTNVPAGAQWTINNNSSAAVTVQSSGANTVLIVAAGTAAVFTALAATPTTAANWDADYDGDIVASGKSLTASNSLTLAGTDGTTMTFPSTSATIASVGRVNSTTSSATPAINTDTTDLFEITALAANITSMTSGLTGTPVDGQKLLIRIKDSGSARIITWGTSFASSGVATLLAGTVASKTHLSGFIYDSAKAAWVCMAVDATGY